ncbi:protein RL1 [Saimiriine betaherpesvirus 4]|uniref:Protein RL1 n=1 Tax=Saimiriine betaherpesvirus 4 TaxID=1535247 RepID=G8XSS4_9BETA|nr:protein RL1 [Saimiriine betaherpesvirus 4]AEV80871.1 protein RL1 [Saimiriine betaherpesvirus 4]
MASNWNTEHPGLGPLLDTFELSDIAVQCEDSTPSMPKTDENQSEDETDDDSDDSQSKNEEEESRIKSWAWDGSYIPKPSARNAEISARRAEPLSSCWCIWTPRWPLPGRVTRKRREERGAVHLLNSRARDGRADWTFLRVRSLVLADDSSVEHDEEALFLPPWTSEAPPWAEDWPRYRIALLFGGHGAHLMIIRPTFDEAASRGLFPRMACQDKDAPTTLPNGLCIRRGTWIASETFPTPLLRQDLSTPSLLGYRPKPVRIWRSPTVPPLAPREPRRGVDVDITGTETVAEIVELKTS